MKHAIQFPRPQSGAALVVGLILLVMLTLLVVGAFSMSTINLQSVNNMQMRDEAIAAANEAIELMISQNFTQNPQAQGYNIDVDKDGDADYQVNFTIPVCLSGEMLPVANPPRSSITLGSAFNATAAQFFNTLWELSAAVTDMNNTGAAIRVRQGLTVMVNQATFTANCPVV